MFAPSYLDVCLYAKLAIPFYYDVVHCIGLVIPLNSKDLPLIMGYNMAFWLHNQIHRGEHQSNYPSSYPRMRCLKVLIRCD